MGKPIDTKDVTKVFPANHLANVLTNKTKSHNSMQLNKPKQQNI